MFIPGFTNNQAIPYSTHRDRYRDFKSNTNPRFQVKVNLKTGDIYGQETVKMVFLKVRGNGYTI